METKHAIVSEILLIQLLSGGSKAPTQYRIQRYLYLHWMFATVATTAAQTMLTLETITIQCDEDFTT